MAGINIPIITSFADKGISAAEKAFGKFGKTGVAVGAAFAASTALVIAGLGKAVNAAIADQKSQALLAKQLENTTGASRMTIAATEDFVTQMQFATGVADDQLRPALGSLVRATNDLTIGQDLLNLALNVSAGTGRDLETVSLALGKAFNGNLGGLTKLGIALDPNIIKTKDFGAAQAELNKQFGGAAAAAANTYEGQLKRLGTVWSELNETIGYAILNNIYVKDAIGRLPDAAAAAVKAFGKGGLGGALDAFLDNMGVVGAYVKMWAASVAHEYNAMARKITNASVILSLGFVQFVPGFKKAQDDIQNNLIMTDLQMQASQMYVEDLTRALYELEAATRRNGAAADRLSGQAEALGFKLPAVTEEIEKTGGAGGKAAKATYEYATALKDGLIAALDEAKGALSDAQKTFNDFADTVAQGLLDAFSFKDAKTAGDDTGKGFLAGLRNQVEGIKDYSNDIQKALNLGLTQEALAAVLAAGGEAGAAIAKELVKGGETAILETNALVESANMAAKKVGINAANAWYQTGVNNAQKTVDGLQAEIDRLTPKMMKQMDALANKLARTVDITVRVNQIVTSVTGGVSTPVPTPVTGGGTGGGVFRQSAGDNYNINVTGVMSTAETGEAVVNALRAYNRAAGPANIQVA